MQPTAPRDKPNLIDGRILIYGSALGCVVLFFIVWASLRSAEQHIHDNQPTLTWSQRADWHAPVVIPTTLVKPNAANAQYTYNKPRYRDPGFEISLEEEQAVLTCAQDARRWSDQSDVYDLPSTIAGTPHFYAEYLRATCFGLGDDIKKQAPERFQFAIEDAPKIIVIRYADSQDNPIPNLKLGRIEIGCDRVINKGQDLDQRLVLVYPHLKTDDAGRVYLPVYDTTYRPVLLPQPEGYDVTYTPAEGWFKLPTRIGLIRAQVSKTPDASTTHAKDMPVSPTRPE